MNDLRVKIDAKKRLAVFSGPGTFSAKETIKQLGRARWVGANKSWEIQPFMHSAADVRRHFPNAVIVEEDTDAAPEENGESCAGAAAQPAAALSGTPAAGGLPASLSVAELNTRVRDILRSSFPPTIFVRGVLSSVKETREGRVFMDLAEEPPSQENAPAREESVSCVIWRDAERICQPLARAGFKLEPDLQVMFEVQVDLSRRRSNLCLSVLGIVPEYTLGKLAAQREVTNERLKREGVFARNRALALPFLPVRLGILTSAGGTVINDFRASLDEARFGFELFWVDASVQGAAARNELLGGLRLLLSIPGLDAVLIFRGGGSAVDLAVFNDYELARAVCLCPIPVVSAIGHEKDQSSVQDVSSLSLGVPKDIGRFFADIVRERRCRVSDALRTVVHSASQVMTLRLQRLGDLSRALHGLSLQLLARSAEALERVRCSLPVQSKSCAAAAARQLAVQASPVMPLANQTINFAQTALLSGASRVRGGSSALFQYWVLRFRALIERSLLLGNRRFELVLQQMEAAANIARTAEQVLERVEQNIGQQEALLAACAPETQLRRGYSLIRNTVDGSFITSGAGLAPDQLINLQFHDCSRQARVAAGEGRSTKEK